MSLSDGLELAGRLLLVLIGVSFGPNCELTPSLLSTLTPACLRSIEPQ